jgi:hypothetical protein
MMDDGYVVLKHSIMGSRSRSMRSPSRLIPCMLLLLKA